MFLRNSLAAAMAAAILVACGGGGDGGGEGSPSTPEGPSASVKVVGDSLNDSGTFGFKFTVQSSGGAPTQIWTDRVATAVSAPALCPGYHAPGGTPALNPAASGCSSFAVGGARINPPGAADNIPASVVQQLKDLRAQGPFNAVDYLLVDGGGNDIADMMAAQALATWDGGASFIALVDELLAPGERRVGMTASQVGEAYALKLANRLADALTAEALDAGARRVVVLNLPDITRTPTVRSTLGAVKALVDAAGQDGTGTADALWDMTQGWVEAFNHQLQARFAGDSRVLVVDFKAAFEGWLDSPVTYGLTNRSHAACPATGVDALGVPTYNLATCSEASLSATPPGGNWWENMFFSDGFHGTPRANELMGERVLQAIEAQGWK